MPRLSTICGALLGAASLAAGSALPVGQPFEQVKSKRQAQADSNLQVDLGYEVYEGYNNQTTGLNIWKGYGFNLQSSNVKNV